MTKGRPNGAFPAKCSLCNYKLVGSFSNVHAAEQHGFICKKCRKKLLKEKK